MSISRKIGWRQDFDGRSVKVELARTKQDAGTRVAETGSVADDGQRAKRRGIDIARSAAESAQPPLHAAGRGNVGVGRALAVLMDCGCTGCPEGPTCVGIERLVANGRVVAVITLATSMVYACNPIAPDE